MNQYGHEIDVREVPAGSQRNSAHSDVEEPKCSIFFSAFFALGLWFLLLSKLFACGEDEESASQWTTTTISPWGEGGSDDSEGGYCWFVNEVWFWLTFGFLYVIYLICTTATSVYTYLPNQLTESCKEYLARLIQAKPRLKWEISCYHSVSRSSTDSHGNSSSSTEHVTTHRATEFYEFQTWKDVTGAVQIPVDPSLLRLSLETDKCFADESTARDYSEKLASWVAANDRDLCKNVTETVEIDGFHERVLSHERNPSECSCFYSSPVFWIMTVLILGPIYICIFYCSSKALGVKIVKSVSMHQPMGYVPPMPSPYGVAPVPGYPLDSGVPQPGMGVPIVITHGMPFQ